MYMGVVTSGVLQSDSGAKDLYAGLVTSMRLTRPPFTALAGESADGWVLLVFA